MATGQIIFYLKINISSKCFHNKLINDLNIDLKSLHRPIEQSFENYKKQGYSINKIFPTFGKLLNEFIEKRKIFI